MKRLLTLVVLLTLVSLPVFAQDETSDSPWSHESELGIALTGGNSDSKTVSFKQLTSYTFGKNIVRLNGLFLWTRSSGSDTARNWMAGLRYERVLTELISAFLGHSWEGDKFAGYDYRANIDAGGKIYIVKGDKKKNYFLNETGYRYSYEDKVAGVTPNSLNSHYLRFYFEAAKSITAILFLKAWTEFLADLIDKNNFQLNFEPSLNVILSKYFSLKLGYLGKFDNVPAEVGLKKFDWIYTTALVGKF